MKIICISLLILAAALLPSAGHAQTLPPVSQISLGTAPAGGIEPGARLGYRFTWKELGATTKRMPHRHYRLYWEPNAGFFTKHQVHTSYLLGTDFGIIRQAEGRKSWMTASAGLRYMARMELLSYSVDFSGNITNKERDRWDFIQPTFNYEYGGLIWGRLGGFVRIDLGWRLGLSSNAVTSFTFLPAAGFTYNFNRPTTEKTATE